MKYTPLYTVIVLIICLSIVIALLDYMQIPMSSRSTTVVPVQQQAQQDVMEQKIAPMHSEDVMDTTSTTGVDIGAIVTTAILGEWTSVSDPKFVRRFTEAKVADIYNKKVISTGLWRIFTKENPVSVPFPIEANAAYVQMDIEGGATLNFKVLQVTPEKLVLMYMDKGNILEFTK